MAAAVGLEELLDLLARAFGAEKTEYFRRVITLDPEQERGRTFIRRAGNTLVAAVQVFYRRMRWGDGREAVVGVIGNVATHPDWQGRGLAGGLLQEAMDWMRGGPFALGLLFTGMQGYYERWGWRPAPYRYPAVPVTRADCRCDMDIRPVAPADLTPLAAIYRAAPGASYGPFLRSGQYWSRHLQWVAALGREAPDAFYVATGPDRSAPVAYVRCGLGLGDRTLRVLEAGAAPGAAAAYSGLLAAAFARARSDGLSTLELHLPPGHPLLELLALVGDAEWRVRRGPMLNDLGRPGALQPTPVKAQPFFWQTDWV